MKGLWGRCSGLDLGSGELRELEIPTAVSKDLLGGKGVAAWAVTRTHEPRVDPLSPENAVVIATGPLQASALPSTGRCAMATKSPSTGINQDSFVGEEFGSAFKRAGKAPIRRRRESSRQRSELSRGSRFVPHYQGLRTSHSRAGAESALFESRGFVRTAGGVSRAVRVGASTGELPAIDDQILAPDRATFEPAFQGLAHPGRVTRLRR